MIKRYHQNQSGCLPLAVFRIFIFFLIVISLVTIFICSIYHFTHFRVVVLSVYPFFIPVLLGSLVLLLCLTRVKFINRMLPSKSHNVSGNITSKNYCTIGMIIALGIILFLLPVFNAWDTMSSKNTLFGIFPASDGPAYYMGAKEIIYYGVSESANERRPINTVLFAVRLALTGQNYQGAILIQAILLGLSCILSSFIIAGDLGKVAGILFFILLFSFGRKFVASPLTEALGLSLGTLAFSLLWYGARRLRIWIFAFGIFMMTVALNARPGTIFILPFLLIWVCFFWGEEKYSLVRRWKGVSICIGAIFAGFVLQTIVGIAASGKFSPGHDNFVHLVYATSVGENGWKSYQALSEEKKENLWVESWGKIKENPSNLVAGMMKRFNSFIIISSVEILQRISFFDGAIHLPPDIQREYNIPAILKILKINFLRIFDVFLHLFFFISALLFFLKNSRKPEVRLIIMSLFGFYLSGIVIGNVAVPRVIHTTIPFILIIYVFGILNLNLKGRDEYNRIGCTYLYKGKSISIYCIYFLSTILIILMITGSNISHATANDIPSMEKIQKSDKDYLIICADKGMPHINVWPDTTTFETFIPDTKLSDYHDALEKPYTRMMRYGFKQLDNIKPPLTIALAYNFSRLNRSKAVFVVGPPKMLLKDSKMLKLYGKYLIPPGGKKQFFFVKSYEEFR